MILESYKIIQGLVQDLTNICEYPLSKKFLEERFSFQTQNGIYIMYLWTVLTHLHEQIYLKV